MKRIRLLKIMFGIVALGFTLAVCMHSTAVQAQPSTPSRFPAGQSGLLLPMTGQDAINGQIHFNAFSLARDEINEAGGIKCLGGAPIELVVVILRASPRPGMPRPNV